MIPKEIKYNLHYDETFYGRHTEHHQLQYSKIQAKRIAFGTKEHIKSRKSETRFDWVSSYTIL